MKRYEISKQDFEVLDATFRVMIGECERSHTPCGRVEQLKDLFAKAHTGYLEIEDE